MDNLSHSVTGMATGALLHRCLPQESVEEHQRLRGRLLLVTCWLASNFPDLDLILTPLLPEPLGYLLHHRGHTHTLLYAIPQVILLSALLWLLWPGARQLLRQSALARIGFALSSVAGFSLHLLMDYLNSYGLHPFHPFDSSWRYGDMVFILEPVFWIAFGVPLAMMVRLRTLRILLLALLSGVPLYFTTKAFLPWTSFAALAGIAAVLALWQFKAGMRGIGALVASFAVSLGFIGVQHVASTDARQLVVRSLQQKDPASEVLDVALTAFPANPMCWTFASVESNEQADSYRLRRGVLSIAPQILPVSHCPASLAEQAQSGNPESAVALVSAYEGSLHALRSLKQESCHFNAWLRFARVPFLQGTYATDVRYASSPRGNFTSMNVEDFNGQECSPYIPQWDFPRADMLSSRPRQQALSLPQPD